MYAPLVLFVVLGALLLAGVVLLVIEDWKAGR